jgi:hypothetical protein
MKRLLLALATGVLLLLLVGVGTATAGPPAGQGSGQSAGSNQAAGAAGGTAQKEPSNSNSPVRVLSPGDAGSVAQSNEASSNATAANVNGTKQSADQNQAGGSGLQAIGQSATNAQDALALALTLQQGAKNENAPVRVGSDGEDDSVSQSNSASSDAAAGNANATEQAADQNQAGLCCNAAGSQTVGQSAGNEQDAAALSATVQEKPSNSNVPVRVSSPGDDGSVTQSNEATSDATAANLNGTKQTADQTQSGGSGRCGCGSQSSRLTADVCGCPSADMQVVGQSADNAQEAKAAAVTEQSGASNENISVRVLSPGSNGPVTQSNVASSNAAAGNANATEQSAGQNQAGSGGGSQIVGQSASSEQGATALSGTIQENPSNTNISVRVLSPGDDGPVSQSNVASSNATAANVNGTKQAAEQTQAGGSDSCKCGSAGTQVIGQSADNHQGALAGSLTEQKGASNQNISVRVLSPGSNGSVTQSNVASSNAAAGNANATEQKAGQNQAGGSCKCGDAGTQVIGQSAQNAQGAAALSATIQEKPSNTNVPVRVLSPGDDGAVSQSNVASSNATAANLNGTNQEAGQSQAGGSGIQAIGQESTSGQLALSAALTAQLGASNENAPVRVLSPGNGGSVSQSNSASSNAIAGNANWTGQSAGQAQGSGKGCCGTGIQAIGQSSQNWQGAGALAVTLQQGLKPPCRCQPDSQIGNSNAPTRVSSPGDDGSVRQSNNASSDAKAANWNATTQAARQLQGRADACRCAHAGTGIQAIGQLSGGHQLATSLAGTLQLDASNDWAPDRKSSPGNLGALVQRGSSAAHDAAGSRTATDQSRNQVGR